MTMSRPTATISRTSHGSLSADDFNLSPQEADDYAVVRIRNAAFDAVHKLWRQRQAEGLNQQRLAEALERDKGWVSRALSGPANWEFKTFARLVRALRGEAEIAVLAQEDVVQAENYHAYRDHDVGSIPTTSTVQPVKRQGEAGQVIFLTRTTT